MPKFPNSPELFSNVAQKYPQRSGLVRKNAKKNLLVSN
jgi:hypothetical protein